MLQTFESNLAYKKHRENIKQFHTTSVSPKDHLNQMRGKNYSLQRTRRFENQSKYFEEEKSNMRLLNKFIEIQRG